MLIEQPNQHPITDSLPDLTSEERQLLLDIRRRKAELLQEISQLKEEITEISGEIDAMDTEEGWVTEMVFDDDIYPSRMSTFQPQLKGTFQGKAEEPRSWQEEVQHGVQEGRAVPHLTRACARDSRGRGAVPLQGGGAQ